MNWVAPVKSSFGFTGCGDPSIRASPYSGRTVLFEISKEPVHPE
jgi:hypothetical protein